MTLEREGDDGGVILGILQTNGKRNSPPKIRGFTIAHLNTPNLFSYSLCFFFFFPQTAGPVLQRRAFNKHPFLNTLHKPSRTIPADVPYLLPKQYFRFGPHSALDTHG